MHNLITFYFSISVTEGSQSEFFMSQYKSLFLGVLNISLWNNGKILAAETPELYVSTVIIYFNYTVCTL